MNNHTFEAVECIYENNLSTVEHINDWKLEGQARMTVDDKRLVLESELDPAIHGDDSHWVLWCPIDFPDRIMIEWDFYPIEEPGLCMIFFAAQGKGGQDLFDSSLPKRTGRYPQYHSGAINALHLSYFRHKHAEERAFRTCNLRKSYGFHLVSHGADPLPPVSDAMPPYSMKVVKYDKIVQLSINDLPVLEWEDDGESYGPVFEGGKIGFRQMSPMKAAYANLRILRVKKIK
ncbi:DUF1961 family protein [Salipaludibacillus sp. HK11]|uniref:DUF1961 family protein n=1 Tax=Salipaludibacillus sp. HK11 TaxID=3394320 RepID=UPI0039FCD7CA